MEAEEEGRVEPVEEELEDVEEEGPGGDVGVEPAARLEEEEGGGAHEQVQQRPGGAEGPGWGRPRRPDQRPALQWMK